MTLRLLNLLAKEMPLSVGGVKSRSCHVLCFMTLWLCISLGTRVFALFATSSVLVFSVVAKRSCRQCRAYSGICIPDLGSDQWQHGGDTQWIQLR